MSATANAEFDIGDSFETPDRGTAMIDKIARSNPLSGETWSYEIHYEYGGTEKVLEDDLLDRVRSGWQRR